MLQGKILLIVGSVQMSNMFGEKWTKLCIQLPKSRRITTRQLYRRIQEVLLVLNTAATGSGGEIRDEGAVGQGSKPKAGLVGFSVSNLNIPGIYSINMLDFIQPWEVEKVGKSAHIASALEIMIQGPLGAAGLCITNNSIQQ